MIILYHRLATQMPMTFDLLPNPQATKKTRFTVVLACLANSTKLKPVVICKQKTLPKGVKFISGVIVQDHLKRWMDEAGTQQRLHQVRGTPESEIDIQTSRTASVATDAFQLCLDSLDFLHYICIA